MSDLNEEFVASVYSGGGTFFPLVQFPLPSGGTFSSKGISIRDWFAGQALMGWVAAMPPINQGTIDGLKFARASYALTDAMIKAREEQP